MKEIKKGDLLRKKLEFKLTGSTFDSEEAEFLFKLVRLGKVIQLAEFFQGRSANELEELVNEKDMDGRTALFHACFYNYKNIVLYLMMKGADPSVIDIHGNSVFHLLVYKGNIESLVMIINYFYFDLREYVDDHLHSIKKMFALKKSDVRRGELVSPDMHQPEVKENYEKFSFAVLELYKDYHERVGG